MAWHGILGHDDVVEKLRRALARGRLATSFLFAGPEGIGKRSFALKLAQALLCRERPEEALDPCGQCPACVQAAALTHPDLDVVSKPADKSFLPLALFIGDPEHRMREGLCHRIGMKPMLGGRKVAIIDDADFLNAEGANCLLKVLEEPPPQSVLILIGTSPTRQLPTIRSRCQLVRFRPLAADAVATILVQQGLVADAAEAQRLARHSGGSVRRAVELADPALWEFRSVLYERLQEPILQSVRLAAAVTAFVEAAGKEAQPRRARLRQVVAFAAEFYQHLVRRLEGAAPAENDLGPWIDRAAAAWPKDARAAAACAERCLDALEHIDRNVQPATVIESWLDALAAITLPAAPARR